MNKSILALHLIAACFALRSLKPAWAVSTLVRCPDLRRAWLALIAIIGGCILLLFMHAAAVFDDAASVESLISALIFVLGAVFVDAVSRLSLRTAREMMRVEDLAEAAYLDALTGIGNLRRFSEALATAVSEANLLEVPLSVITLDIDHFKHVNDTYGHAVGDHVLKEIGATLRDATRPSDAVCRIGGEEFAIVVPRLHRGDALALADRVRVAVAGRRVEIGGGRCLNVTVSVGFAALLPGESTPDLLGRADKALYAAKRSGRDRVKIAA